MSPEATEWINGVRRVNAELAGLLEGELKRGVSLVVVRQTLARLMLETHPEVVAKHLSTAGQSREKVATDKPNDGSEDGGDWMFGDAK